MTDMEEAKESGACSHRRMVNQPVALFPHGGRSQVDLLCVVFRGDVWGRTTRFAGNVEDEDRFSKRTVSMTKEHQEDCKRLLRLMGVPVVEAPCEAESQFAALARAGKVCACLGG